MTAMAMIAEPLMEPGESKIQKIILAHIALISEYNNVLKSTNGEGFFIIGRYENRKYSVLDLYHLIKKRDVSVLDKITIIMKQVLDPFSANSSLFYRLVTTLVTTLLKDPFGSSELVTTVEHELVITEHRIIRSLAKFLIKTHVKRQYGAIYPLYLSEILKQNGIGENQEKYDTLRDIASDLKNYLDTLPSAKSIFASMVAVFTVIATAIGLFQIGNRIFEFIVQLQSPFVFPIVIIVIIASIIIGYIVIIPFLFAFRFKRHLFLRTKNLYYLNDVYFGSEQQLYNNSIYKLEDDLFAALGARHEKLNEVPFDKIFIISTGTWIVSFFAYLGLSAAFSTVPFLSAVSTSELFGLLVTLLVTLYAIILPISTYRHRRTYGLL